MIRGVYSHVELCHYSTIKGQYSGTNSWNVNLTSTNANTNNNSKTNTNRVVAFADCLTDDFFIFFLNMLAAYCECRRNKRRSISCVLYEMRGPLNTLELAYDIYTRQYSVSPSICFLIYVPTYREVFAASFRDRIIHTWIAMRIEPLLETYLSDSTYSNRKGRGATGAINALEKIINEYPTYWIWKFDLQGFFMSIDKRLLWKEFEPFVRERYDGNDLDYLIYSTKIALFNTPQENCVRMCPEENWKVLPSNKSLFNNPWWKGLPIGDLLSQMMVGFFLKPFIDYLNTLDLKLVVHYVDDFVVLHESKEHILECIPKIRSWLMDNRGVTLHPRKSYIQHASKGVKFLGGALKPHKRYVGDRTVKNAFKIKFPRSLKKTMCIINSYLGFFRQYMTYNLRKRLAEKCFKKFHDRIYFGKSYSKLVIKKSKKKKNK